MQIKNIFFDMDGTILDTLQDILDAVNFALKECGYERVHTYEDGKRFIGGGAYVLAARALAFTDYTDEELTKFREVFFQHYQEFQDRNTKPFPGMINFLRDLKKKYRLFIISNKPDFLLQEIVHKKLEDSLFCDLIGHKEENPEKPDPFAVNEMISKHHLNRDECIYVGDSIIDIQTAINAKVKSCLVTYGYGQYNKELLKKADYTASNVEDLRKLFL